jgi:hypothetical protein
MFTSRRHTFTVLLVAAVAGCGGSGSSGGSRTSLTPSGATPPSTVSSSTPPPSATPPSGTGNLTLRSALLASSAGYASKGDTVTLTFSDEAKLGPASNPGTDLVLPVSGDTFGANATFQPGATPVQLVIVLGDRPMLRSWGTFDPKANVSGDPSGVAVAPGTTITDAQGRGALVSAPVDLDGGALAPTIMSIASPQVARAYHTTTLLDDGRLLVVGGLSAGAGTGSGYAPFIYDAEIYDPAANTFTKVTDPAVGGNVMSVTPAGSAPIFGARAWHTATKLLNGQVLIAGGFGTESYIAGTTTILQAPLASAHVFDPKTNTFTQVGSLRVPRYRHVAVLLASGQVLIAGGASASNATTATTEIYDPVTRTFTAGSGLTRPRQDCAALALTGGVLVSGGADDTGTPAVVAGAELVSSAGPSKATGNPAQDLRAEAGLVLGGAPYLFGGDGVTAGTASGAIQTYDTAKGSFSAVGALGTPRTFARAEVVGSSLAVIAGGTAWTGRPSPELASVELWSATTKSTVLSLAMKNARQGLTATRARGGVILIGGMSGDPGLDVLSLGGTVVPTAEKLVIP